MFPKEGYFYLKSVNDLVLNLNGEDEAGSKLVIGPKTDDDSELWSFDNGYLVNKKTSLVVDIEGGDLRSDKHVLQYDRKKTMAHNQRWGIRDGFIYPVADPRLVLNVKEEEEGSKVVVAVRKLEDNALQQWKLEPYEGEY